MKPSIVDYYDVYKDIVVFSLQVKNVDKNFIAQAQKIDEEDFSHNYFRVWLTYDINNNLFFFDNGDESLSYISNYKGIIKFKCNLEEQEYIDSVCEELWIEFIHNNEKNKNRYIINDWFIFKKIDLITKIYEWFDEHYSKGVKALEN